MPTFLSLFSGIGGLDLGLERAGWRCVGQVEIDPYRRGILERWWPNMPRIADIKSCRDGHRADPTGAAERGTWGSIIAARPDLICGGFPCQDLSVAGKRAGLKGSRSSLFFEFARIADAVRPTWLLVENVPGLLSSHGGRDFAVVLATLADLGYGVAWRVLDSRYFGVPQRRRRVFVVGHLGAEGPEPFLPFLEGGEGDPAQSGTAGEGIAGTLGGGSGKRGWCDDTDRATFVTAIQDTRELEKGQHGLGLSGEGVAYTLDGTGAQGIAHSLTSEGHDASEDGTGRGTPLLAFTLGQNDRNRSQGPANYIAAPLSHGSNPNSNAAGRRREDDVNLAYSLRRDPGGTGQGHNTTYIGGVRRLTPIECCRLQGLPDDWLGGNEPPDSPKYAALGDAVTVPVAEWIGSRLLEASR
jgi:DNA (cytosine-5)-methyltransferase 1